MLFHICIFDQSNLRGTRSQRTRRGAVNTSVVTMLTECLAGTGIAQIFAVVARDLLKNKLVELI